MPDNQYGPDQPCQRTACIDSNREALRAVLLKLIQADADTATLEGQRELIRNLATGDHLGGAHLDPTDRAHYDGLRALAMPSAVRTAVRPLMQRVRAFIKPTPDDTEPRVDVDVALDACFREIDRLRQQVAHVQVDADRKVRDASRRALDCIDHGTVIADLERQLTHFEQAGDRTEKARLALLAEHQALGDWLNQRRQAEAAGARHDVNADKIATALQALHAKTSRAHARAYGERRNPA